MKRERTKKSNGKKTRTRTKFEVTVKPPRGMSASQAQFQKGNELWKLRSTWGPKPKFKRAKDLWKACCEYFDSVNTNPLYEQRVVGTYYGEPITKNVPKMRPMTVGGLCLFLDVAVSCWYVWRSERDDLKEIIARVEEVIRTQKFEGAVVGFFSSRIISRDLGLVDRKDTTSGGGPIGGSKTVIVLPEKTVVEL